MLRELLITLAPQLEDAAHPGGIGVLLHGGREIKCQGEMGPNPRFAEDSAAGFDPPAEILIQHVIGTLSGGPDDVHPIPHPDMPDSNPEVNDSIFTLDPAQTGLDPTNPKCQVCGKSINLKL